MRDSQGGDELDPAEGVRRREVLLRFWQASVSDHFWEVQHDRGPIGSLELHGRRGSRKDLKYSRRILVGERLGPRREG